MLSVLRHKGVAKKVLWIVTVIIILSFAIFGSAYQMDNNLNSAGTMYGKGVNYRDFQETYLDARDQAILVYGDEFFKRGQQIDLEQQTWDRLILLKEAKKQNIKISDKEVIDFIAQIPFFQRQGQFEQSLYQMIVKDRTIFNRRSTREFEEGVRRNLMVRKVIEAASEPTTVSEEELKKEFTLRNEKITLDYATVKPVNFAKDITVTDAQLNEFYLKNKEAYRLPAMIKVDYVHIPVDEKANDAIKNEAKKKIYNLSAQLTATSDFATLAKTFGLEIKQSDYFSLDKPILTFASSPEETEKMFAMKKGQFTKPLNVPDGWQIIRINDKKESFIPEFAVIQEQVKKDYISNESYTLAKKKAEELLPQLTEAAKKTDFKTAATSLGLSVEQTPSFSRGEYIANVGLVRELQADTLKLTKDNPFTGVIPTSQGPVIAHLVKVEAIDEKQFNDGKEEFRQMLEAKLRQQKIAMFMTQLRLAANVKSKVKQQR